MELREVVSDLTNAADVDRLLAKIKSDTGTLHANPQCVETLFTVLNRAHRMAMQEACEMLSRGEDRAWLAGRAEGIEETIYLIRDILKL